LDYFSSWSQQAGAIRNLPIRAHHLAARPAAARPWPPPPCSQYRLLTEDGRKVGDIDTLPWPEGFNEYDGGSIEGFGEQGVLYKINYDNVYHLKYRRAARGGDVGRDVITEKYILMVTAPASPNSKTTFAGWPHAVQLRQSWLLPRIFRRSWTNRL
jgi:hypothetical protein